MSRDSGIFSIIEEIVSEGQHWITGLAMIAIALLLPFGLEQSHWVSGVRHLWPVGLMAVLLGMILGQKERYWWHWPGSLLLGFCASFLFGGQLWPPYGRFGERTGEVWRRVTWWLQVIWLGGASDDPMIPLLVLALILWLVCFWLAWAVLVIRKPLLAVLPAGFLLAVNTFFGLGGALQLFLFAPLALLLLAQGQIRQLETDGASLGMIQGSNVRMQSLAYALPVVALALTLGVFFPYLHNDSLSKAFWSKADKQWNQVVRLFDWLFPSLRGQGDSPSWWAGAASAAMPQSRLLQGEVPDEQERTVMYVRTSDPAPMPALESPERLGLEESAGPVRYWRGMTYDIYTGRGWANSRVDLTQVEAGQRFYQPEGTRQEVTQQFEILALRDELVFAAAEPVSFDATIRPRWRGENDMAFIHASVGKYSVVSLASQATIQQLRQTGKNYPAEISEHYLQLPNLPERVPALAVEITAGTATAYDKLAAIESYLRQYTYDLSVTLPAEDKDIVDYFLFEGKRGYCDYYASAMVVLARTLGIPTRLASGFTGGTYDYETGRYVVSERNAHSWVEAYFPGYGWIEFEPTAAQARIIHQEGQAPKLAQPLPSVEPERALPLSILIVSILAALGIIGCLFWEIRHLRRRKLLRHSDAALAVYAAMEARGWQLGYRAPEGTTAREYARGLARYVAKIETGVTSDNGQSDDDAVYTMIAAAYEGRRYNLGRNDNSTAVAAGWKRLDGELRALLRRQLPQLLLKRFSDWRNKLQSKNIK